MRWLAETPAECIAAGARPALGNPGVIRAVECGHRDVCFQLTKVALNTGTQLFELIIKGTNVNTRELRTINI